jgi:hypothetical protein
MCRMAPMSSRRRINLSVEQGLYEELERRAGAAGVPAFTLGLVKRALGLDAQPQLDLGGPEQERRPQQDLRRPQQVRLDVEPLLEPMRDLHEITAEVLRAVHQYGHYLMLRARADNHEPTVMLARDEAQREVARWTNRYGGEG